MPAVSARGTSGNRALGRPIPVTPRHGRSLASQLVSHDPNNTLRAATTLGSPMARLAGGSSSATLRTSAGSAGTQSCGLIGRNFGCVELALEKQTGDLIRIDRVPRKLGFDHEYRLHVGIKYVGCGKRADLPGFRDVAVGIKQHRKIDRRLPEEAPHSLIGFGDGYRKHRRAVSRPIEQSPECRQLFAAWFAPRVALLFAAPENRQSAAAYWPRFRLIACCEGVSGGNSLSPLG